MNALECACTKCCVSYILAIRNQVNKHTDATIQAVFNFEKKKMSCVTKMTLSSLINSWSFNCKKSVSVLELRKWMCWRPAPHWFSVYLASSFYHHPVLHPCITILKSTLHYRKFCLFLAKVVCRLKRASMQADTIKHRIPLYQLGSVPMVCASKSLVEVYLLWYWKCV